MWIIDIPVDIHDLNKIQQYIIFEMGCEEKNGKQKKEGEGKTKRKKTVKPEGFSYFFIFCFYPPFLYNFS